MIEDLVIADLTSSQSSRVHDLVTHCELSWTMDAVSQLTFEIHDPGMQMFRNNYFQIRREVEYRGAVFEIASMEIGQGDSQEASVILECRTAAIQRMKRNEDTQSYVGASPTEFALLAANAFGLDFIGEGTAESKAILSTQKGAKPESVWSVITRLASEAKFSVFESNNTLFFGSQQWLLQKYGNIQLRYPHSGQDPYMILEIPTCRRSDDDVFAAEFTATLAPSNATELRAGMTVFLKGMHDFDWGYLLTEVSYEDGEGKPVSIAARTAELIEPEE